MIEVVFKGERKQIYRNPQQFPFQVGDYAIVEAEKGEDLGLVNQLGSVLLHKAGEQELRNVVRRPNSQEMQQYHDNRRKEFDAYHTCKAKIIEHGLVMKLVDVEYQFDGQKITFYFTAERRVDFRELVKDLASIYKVRIELRQIGVRDEAKRIGGYGCCGRKLCCTSFLKEFDPITTQCAKEQNLPLNPQKLSGLCGRLLCCLMYERDFYQEQSKKMPPRNSKYKTKLGVGTVINYDVFRESVTLAIDGNGLERFTLDELKNLPYTPPPQEKSDDTEASENSDEKQEE